ncbi:hypothetical protein BXZ70DRAFT_1050921 [Cristinia sonorae]|uniref:CUE domain-containing protein n=1 Tax=Cristinia sonorae TaxID=1940300 RepID=A0A8K0XK45_9AGAR|nr:hypothetical protein BXZ70DRAFT_1050921 [Cristinia sonorae]
MGEVVNVIVAFAVIVIIVRWATTSKDGAPSQPSTSSILGFRPKNITTEMVDTIHTMFPDIPTDNIRYDLLRTGNVQVTTNKLLERGFLPAPPPAYYTVYPRTEQPANPTPRATQPQQAAAASSSKKTESLISRYHLEERLASSTGIAASPEVAGGKSVWEESAAKREASLRERKAQMILAARQRLLAQQKAEQDAAAAGSSS